jgi:hypothetical protein
MVARDERFRPPIAVRRAVLAMVAREPISICHTSRPWFLPV